MNYLEDIQECEKLAATTQEVIRILVIAMNDWPKPILYLADFEKEIYEWIGRSADKELIEKYLNSIDYTRYAWEAESFTKILEVYDYYDWQKTIKEIIEELTNDIQEKMSYPI